MQIGNSENNQKRGLTFDDERIFVPIERVKKLLDTPQFGHNEAKKMTVGAKFYRGRTCQTKKTRKPKTCSLHGIG